MNSLGLRINSGGRKVPKNAVDVPAVCFPKNMITYFCSINGAYQSFFMAASYDQVDKLRAILSSQTGSGYSDDLVHFLVMTFLEAPSKHPVKGFVIRHVAKAAPALQNAFSKYLSVEIAKMATNGTDVLSDMLAIFKMSKCIEFSAGIEALGMVADDVVIFFKCTLQRAISIFSIQGMSPSRKNDITNHCHETLRLLLLMIQGYQTNGCADPNVLMSDSRACMKAIMRHDEMPMDTKSLCGIVLLRALVLEVGEKNALKSVFGERESWLKEFFCNDTEVLVVYSALGTKPTLHWTRLKIGSEPAVTKVLDAVVGIGERASSDASITLSVARTVHQLSKYLGTIDKTPTDDHGPITNGPIDSALAEKLAAYVHTVIDHSMDSVRYLAGQTLNHVAKFYNKSRDFDKLKNIMGREENNSIKRSYFLIAENIISSLDEAPQSIVLLIIKNCIMALFTQDLQGAATICLEAIITKCINYHSHYLSIIMSQLLAHLQSKTKHGNVEEPVLEIYDRIVTKILVLSGPQIAMPILQKTYLIDEHSYVADSDLICILVLMRAMQKIMLCPNMQDAHMSGADYNLLRIAAVHPKEEYRMLSLSIVIESKKSTKFFHPPDFVFILYFLKNNISTQAPNFRQVTKSLMKKLVQRLSDSYYVMMREKSSYIECYSRFVAALRASCMAGLMQGSNASRRCTALQVISWLDAANLPETRTFTRENVERLLHCLEDSYETNKQLALQILFSCPTSLLKNHSYSISMSLADILKEASSVKPTDCTSAAYKLMLVEHKGLLGDGENISNVLLSHLQLELVSAKNNLVLASVESPMYGLVHCLRKAMKSSQSSKSKTFIDSVITICMDVNRVVAPIVNNSSPEGHLPMDMAGLVPGADDEGVASSDRRVVGDCGLTLADGKLVTAQMVLLCGWRAVKEVSLFFGEICSNLPIEEGDEDWLISQAQLKKIGDHFITLLSETKHRGAFEQAYVGFTQLATRLWACKTPELHSLPATWLTEVIAEIGNVNNQLCATRRSAGLPGIIQALVITELQVNGNGKYFHLCMSWLLQNALPPKAGTEYKPTPFLTSRNKSEIQGVDGEGTSGAGSSGAAEGVPENTLLEVEVRTHCLNILRALYRNTSLGEAASSRVQHGLMVAINGLDAQTWQERNSATLLLNALIVRVFGVQRSKDSEKLSVRNKMTARIFFLRYPLMYEFMLDMLKVTEEKEKNGVVSHSLFGVLLILSRLYQSSLEGTDSNLKLSAFVAPVMRCGKSVVLQTRRAAAKALASIVPPHQWHAQMIETSQLVAKFRHSVNHVHGIILQLSYLLENAPETLAPDLEEQLADSLRMAFRIAHACGSSSPSHTQFVIRNDLLKIVNRFTLRFKTIITTETDAEILKTDLTKSPIKVAPYYDIYIANLMYYSAIQHLKEIETDTADIFKITTARGGLNQAIDTNNLDALNTAPYELLLAELNFILIIFGKIDEENMCEFQKHINLLLNKSFIKLVVVQYYQNRREVIDVCLIKIFLENTYLECKEKALMILNAFGDTSKKIVQSLCQSPSLSIDDVTIKLIDALHIKHEKLTCMYLESLLNLLTLESMQLRKETLLLSLRVVCRNSTSDNCVEIRILVATFVRKNFNNLLNMNLGDYSSKEIFEHKALLWCTLMTLLEDDSQSIRESAALVATVVTGQPRPQLASAAGESVRQHIANGVSQLEERMALMLLLALFDFHSEVYTQDDAEDVYRVFDQSERYNVYLEETTWSRCLANHILLSYQKKSMTDNLQSYLRCLIEQPDYKETMVSLCDKNLVLFSKMLENERFDRLGIDYWNPKVEYFLKKCL